MNNDDQQDECTTSDAPAIAAEPEEMSVAELAEAKEYGRLQLMCGLTDRAIDVGFLAVMAFVLAGPVDRWLAGFDSLANEGYLRLAALFGITILLHMIVSFPLSLYSGHVLEQRFGLSNQSFGGWLRRYAKRNSLAVGFGLVVFCGIFAMIWHTGPYWWLVAAAAFFVVSVVLGQLLPVLIIPLFYTVERIEDEAISQRLDSLAEGTGLSIEGVYRLGISEETKKANAMLTGLGRTRRVMLGDTLLEAFTPEEIEVVFAHEIGHHVYRHIRKMIVRGVVTSALGFWLCDRLLIAGAGGGAALPVAALPLLMFLLTVFSLVLEPLQNGISRHYERQCDRYALDRTGMNDAYRSAFQKLAKLNKDDPDPHPLEVFLFHDHPPIGQRLAMADQ